MHICIICWPRNGVELHAHMHYLDVTGYIPLWLQFSMYSSTYQAICTLVQLFPHSLYTQRSVSCAVPVSGRYSVKQNIVSNPSAKIK
jgi:hypothetical protein